ncbi:retrotransposon protein, putative, ty1-copia subclass, partial [Tanacetum coccineum]
MRIFVLFQFFDVGDNNVEGSGSASRQAQQTEPAVGQDGLGGSGVGVVIGLSAAAGVGDAGDPGGAGVASQEFKDYLKANGIVQQLTPPYTPQHNGVSEKSATRILNMVPTKKVDKTPYELWYGKVPNLSYLKVWGCEALEKRDTPDKLEQRSVKCE